MSNTDKFSVKEAIAGIAILFVVAIGVVISIFVFRGESAQHEFIVSDAGKKAPDHLEVFINLLTVDPIKGDTTARLEFAPHGKLEAEDHTLAADLKLYIPSANGKTEIDFKKGKAMPPVEAVFSMFGGNAADYSFDAHKASFLVYA